MSEKEAWVRGRERWRDVERKEAGEREEERRGREKRREHAGEGGEGKGRERQIEKSPILIVRLLSLLQLPADDVVGVAASIAAAALDGAVSYYRCW